MGSRKRHSWTRARKRTYSGNQYQSRTASEAEKAPVRSASARKLETLSFCQPEKLWWTESQSGDLASSSESDTAENEFSDEDSEDELYSTFSVGLGDFESAAEKDSSS